MGITDQIFGAPLDAAERERTAPQGADAVVSPMPVAPSDSQDEEAVPTVPMSRLAKFVMDAFRTNSDYRRNSGVDARLNYALMANRCRFTNEQLDALVTKMGIPRTIAEHLKTAVTFVKTRGAKSILGDLLSQSGEPLFDLTHSPVPDIPIDATFETEQSMAFEIQQLLATLAQSGVTQLPPEAEARLMQAVQIVTADRYDDIANQKEAAARNRVRRMKNKVWDLMEEGGFMDAVHDCISNLCVYGTCVLHGPVMRAVECNSVKSARGKTPKYVREVKLKPVFESVSPWDCYPAPDASDTSDGPFCMKVKFAAHDLWTMCDRGAAKEKNGEGWNDAVVRDILDRHPCGDVKLRLYRDSMDADRRELEDRGYEDTNDCTFEGVRCYAYVRGSMLSEMGIVRNRDNKAIRLNDYYRVESVVIEDRVVFCRILDNRMDVPISHAVFYDIPGSWWGESVADKLRLVQTMQDNTAKSLFLDLAGTGPMFWVRNSALLRDKSPSATMFKAYKTVMFDEPMFPGGGSSGVPMGTIEVPSRARELVAEWDRWNQQADNDSGSPRFAEGQSAGQSGALRTSSGLAQFNEHMMRGMKSVLTSFDNSLIRTAVRRMADWELIYGTDMDLKGDVFVLPVGLIGRIMRVQRDQSRMQLFNMIVTNKFLLQLIGPKGVLALLRPSLKDLDVNPDDILPSEQRMKFMEAVEELKQLATAEAQSQQGMAAQAEGAGADAQQVNGAPPGVAQPPQVEMPQGGVEERRAVA